VDIRWSGIRPSLDIPCAQVDINGFRDETWGKWGGFTRCPTLRLEFNFQRKSASKGVDVSSMFRTELPTPPFMQSIEATHMTELRIYQKTHRDRLTLMNLRYVQPIRVEWKGRSYRVKLQR
jgi:hypothetical protein